MGLTVARYNGVTISGAQTRRFNQSLRYDSSSTDAMFLETEIQLVGLVHAEHSRRGVAGSVADNSRQLVAEIQARLLDPRHTLEIAFQQHGEQAAEELPFFRALAGRVDAAQSRQRPEMDVDNGPKPQSCEVEHFTQDLFRVVWTVKVAQQVLDPAGNFPRTLRQDAVISNRWTVEESFDRNWFCDKTISGELRLSVADPVWAVQARYLATPILERGFRREQMTYAVSADGLTVRYRIQDRQIHTAAPWPATEMDVDHTERTDQLGYHITSSCRVNLQGPPQVDKAYLIARAAQILDDRLMIAKNRDSYGVTWWLDDLVITEHIGARNSVSASMTIKRFKLDADTLGEEQEGAWQGIQDVVIGAAAGGVIIGWLGRPKRPAEGISEAKDWFDQLRDELFGAKMRLPVLPYGTEELYDPAESPRPDPLGWQVTGGPREPAAIALWACYQQVPYRPPHGMHRIQWQPAWEEPEEEPVSPGESNPPAEDVRQVEALPDPLPERDKDNRVKAAYNFARASSTYDTRGGRVGLPLSNPPAAGDPGDDVVIVRLHRPSTLRVLKFDVERLGAWPAIPAPVDYEPSWGGQAVLLRWQITPQPPQMGADGKAVFYRIRGEYTYQLTRAPTFGAELEYGLLPQMSGQDLHSLQIGAVSDADQTTFRGGGS